jgi:hypothetical protein
VVALLAMSDDAILISEEIRRDLAAEQALTQNLDEGRGCLSACGRR